MYNGKSDPSVADPQQVNFSIMNTIPTNGYHPVTLVRRGQNMIERSFDNKRKDLTPLQKKNRPRYKLDPRLDKLTDEYFNDVIYKRSSLLHSENIALQQLKSAVGLSKNGLVQLPLQSDQSDRAFAMLQLQMHENSMLKGNVGPNMGNGHGGAINSLTRPQIQVQDLGGLDTFLPAINNALNTIRLELLNPPKPPPPPPPAPPAQVTVNEYYQGTSVKQANDYMWAQTLNADALGRLGDYQEKLSNHLGALNEHFAAKHQADAINAQQLMQQFQQWSAQNQQTQYDALSNHAYNVENNLNSIIQSNKDYLSNLQAQSGADGQNMGKLIEMMRYMHDSNVNNHDANSQQISQLVKSMQNKGQIDTKTQQMMGDLAANLQSYSAESRASRNAQEIHNKKMLDHVTKLDEVTNGYVVNMSTDVRDMTQQVKAALEKVAASNNNNNQNIVVELQRLGAATNPKDLKAAVDALAGEIKRLGDKKDPDNDNNGIGVLANNLGKLGHRLDDLINQGIPSIVATSKKNSHDQMTNLNTIMQNMSKDQQQRDQANYDNMKGFIDQTNKRQNEGLILSVQNNQSLIKAFNDQFNSMQERVSQQDQQMKSYLQQVTNALLPLQSNSLTPSDIRQLIDKVAQQTTIPNLDKALQELMASMEALHQQQKDQYTLGVQQQNISKEQGAYIVELQKTIANQNNHQQPPSSMPVSVQMPDLSPAIRQLQQVIQGFDIQGVQQQMGQLVGEMINHTKSNAQRKEASAQKTDHIIMLMEQLGKLREETLGLGAKFDISPLVAQNNAVGKAYDHLYDRQEAIHNQINSVAEKQQKFQTALESMHELGALTQDQLQEFGQNYQAINATLGGLKDTLGGIKFAQSNNQTGSSITTNTGGANLGGTFTNEEVKQPSGMFGDTTKSFSTPYVPPGQIDYVSIKDNYQKHKRAQGAVDQEYQYNALGDAFKADSKVNLMHTIGSSGFNQYGTSGPATFGQDDPQSSGPFLKAGAGLDDVQPYDYNSAFSQLKTNTEPLLPQLQQAVMQQVQVQHPVAQMQHPIVQQPIVQQPIVQQQVMGIQNDDEAMEEEKETPGGTRPLILDLATTDETTSLEDTAELAAQIRENIKQSGLTGIQFVNKASRPLLATMLEDLHTGKSLVTDDGGTHVFSFNTKSKIPSNYRYINANGRRIKGVLSSLKMTREQWAEFIESNEGTLAGVYPPIEDNSNQMETDQETMDGRQIVKSTYKRAAEILHQRWSEVKQGKYKEMSDLGAAITQDPSIFKAKMAQIDDWATVFKQSIQKYLNMAEAANFAIMNNLPMPIWLDAFTNKVMDEIKEEREITGQPLDFQTTQTGIDKVLHKAGVKGYKHKGRDAKKRAMQGKAMVTQAPHPWSHIPELETLMETYINPKGGSKQKLQQKQVQAHQKMAPSQHSMNLRSRGGAAY